jgi:hypothetical protein
MLNIKRRIIVVENSIVVAESTSLDIDATSAFTDPRCMFAVGDTFSAERYALLYGTNPYSQRSDLDAVFILPANSNEEAIFAAAGLASNIQPHKKSKYVYLSAESSGLLSEITAYGNHHNIRIPNFILANKEAATQRYVDAGFPTLLTVPIRTLEDVAAFPFGRAILKPVVSTNSKAVGHLLESALYTIKTKAELLSLLDGLGAFSDPSILANNPIIAQQVADGDGGNFEALILSGAVNGSGAVWHFATIELATQYNDSGRYVKSVWSPESSTAETAQLQQQVERLLADVGSVNCFYQLQFLRSNGAWVPHDFQYRMTYYTSFGLEALGLEQYKVDAIKFAFDRSEQKPEQQLSFGLKHAGTKLGVPKYEFVSGVSKVEVLAKLELL